MPSPDVSFLVARRGAFFVGCVLAVGAGSSGCDLGRSMVVDYTADDGEAYEPTPLPEDASELPPVAPDGYFVVGNTIYGPDLEPHVFRGVDRPSLEWNALGENLSLEDYQRMASWNSNVVRIALNQGFYLQSSFFYSSGYAELVDQNVQWAKDAGMDVILDLHWSDRGDASVRPDQQRMADARSIEFWTAVASRYKDDGRVIFELYNEPHDISPDAWLNGGRTVADGALWDHVGMQALYDAVRATGAHNVVLVGGLDYAYSLGHVPENRVVGYNIAYVTHPYDSQSKQPNTWREAFGDLAKTDPIVATEFGDFTCDGSYSEELIEYAEARRIGWTAWAWFPGGCQFPGLLADWNGTPNAAGEFIRESLMRYNP